MRQRSNISSGEESEKCLNVFPPQRLREQKMYRWLAENGFLLNAFIFI